MPVEIDDVFTGASKLLSGEMTPREGVLATLWLGLDTVLPCYYINPDCKDVRDFTSLM